jgi:carbonic anhydrase/acetyltransferase-like protein (isoleucine patch superfamily)
VQGTSWFEISSVMASRTIVDSVAIVDGPPLRAPELAQILEELRLRWPGAIFERYLERVPSIDRSAFVAAGASVVGDVRVGAQASIWFGCVLRGDLASIEIGVRSNVQDGTVIHVGDQDPTRIGDDVVVGHRAVLHGCTIGDRCLIGMQATILDGAKIGHGSIVGSCALVTAASEIPPNSLVLGVPAKVVRQLDPGQEAFTEQLAAKYCRLAHNYRNG